MTAADTDTIAAASDALLAGVVELIEDNRAQLASAFAATASESAPKYCTLTSSHHEACDRPPGHDGECSWALTQTIRRYRDAEVKASKVPALENQLATAKRLHEQAERALDAYRIPDPSDPDKTILIGPATIGRRRRGG